MINQWRFSSNITHSRQILWRLQPRDINSTVPHHSLSLIHSEEQNHKTLNREFFLLQFSKKRTILELKIPLNCPVSSLSLLAVFRVSWSSGAVSHQHLQARVFVLFAKYSSLGPLHSTLCRTKNWKLVAAPIFSSINYQDKFLKIFVSVHGWTQCPVDVG